MSFRIASRFLPVFLLAAGSVNTPGIAYSSIQGSTASPVLKVSGDVPIPLALTSDELKKMPRKTVAVVNPHDKKVENYEGVLVEDLLKKAGVPQGEDLKGPWLASYLVFEAADGYRVVFSIAELDSGIVDSGVIVADTLDGAPLPTKQGSFRLIAPHEKRAARWVRMLKSITVARVSTS
jgi:DMSO/TMAO reductase YedYZ molybdopterin-dependent catalytic subunit